jgi:CDGSH-type Zn-finger protein
MPGEARRGRRSGSIRIPGPLILVNANGEEVRVEKKRVGFCRCGASKDRPLCDKSCREIGFEAEEFFVRPG